MGADFLFSCIIIKKGKNLKELESQLLEQCKSLTYKDLNQIDRDTILNTFDLTVTDETFPELIMLLTDTIKDTFETLDNRECSCLVFKGYHIHLTGGMSYGDAPTDAFDTFNRFNSMPLSLHKLLK